MRNSAMFQKFIDEADAIVGVDSSADGSVGLFHVLAACFDWCETTGVDFDKTLVEVRECLAEEADEPAPDAFLDVLRKYVSPDDAGLPTRERLRLVADRITDDIA